MTKYQRRPLGDHRDWLGGSFAEAVAAAAAFDFLAHYGANLAPLIGRVPYVVCDRYAVCYASYVRAIRSPFSARDLFHGVRPPDLKRSMVMGRSCRCVSMIGGSSIISRRRQPMQASCLDSRAPAGEPFTCIDRLYQEKLMKSRRRDREKNELLPGTLEALQRMLLNGWVTAEWKISVNKRRARFYKLTAAGREQLGIEESAFEQIFGAIRRVMRTT